MQKRVWVTCGVSALSVLGAVGCGEQAPTEELKTDVQAVTGGPHLLFHNDQTGEFGAWLLSGGTVTGTKSLDATCGSDDNCDWGPFYAGGNSVWFANGTSGEVAAWTFDGNGHVTFNPSLTWTCSLASGCWQTWFPIAEMNLKPKGCTGLCPNRNGILWYNPNTGELSIWLLASDGITVTGAQSLSWRCGLSDHCSNDWALVATGDFDGDTTTDIVWFNHAAGVVSVWLIKDDSGTVKGTQTLSWNVADDSGWWPNVAADVNGDGRTDLLWHHFQGAFSNWLLDGRGNVTGTQALSWSCGPGCYLPPWSTVGYVTFPAGQPR